MPHHLQRLPYGVLRVLALVLLLGPVVAFGAEAGTRDPLFAPYGFIDGTVNHVVPLPDGRFLALGSFSEVAGRHQPSLSRFNADGTPDWSFQPDVDGTVLSVAVLEDGRLLIGGAFTHVNGDPHSRLARLNADGSVDTSFTADADGNVYGVIIQPTGKVVVAGFFTHINGDGRAYLARLNADGSTDVTFAADCDGPLYRSMEAAPDGGIFVLGYFTAINGTSVSKIARLSADGETDETFVHDIDGAVEAVAVGANGSAVIGGRFTKIDGVARSKVARFLADGSLDATFSPGPLGDVFSLVVQTDGKIVAGGSYQILGGSFHTGLTRLLAAGTQDNSFSPPAASFAPTVAIQADGKILTAGFGEAITRLQNDMAGDALNVADASKVVWLRSGAAPEVLSATFDLSTDGGVTWIELGSAARIAEGWELSGLSLPDIGVIRARARLATGSGCQTLLENQTPYGLMQSAPQPALIVEAPDGSELAPGQDSVVLDESRVAQTFTIHNAGNAPLKISGIRDLGGLASTLQIDLSGLQYCVPAGGSTSFTLLVSPIDEMTQINSLEILSNDPAIGALTLSISAPGGESSHIALAGFSVVNQETFSSFPISRPYSPYIDTYFVTVPYNEVSAVLNLDYASNQGAEPGVSVDGNALTSPKQYYFAEGHLDGVHDVILTSPDGTATRTIHMRVVRPPAAPGDIDRTFAPPFSAGSVLNSVLMPDGGMLLWGNFTMDGTQRLGLLKTLANGSLDAGFSTQISGVGGMAVSPAGLTYVWGGFSKVNGVTRRYLARLRSDGSLDPSFRPDISSPVNAVALEDDGSVLVGGGFSSVNGVRRDGIARLNENGTLDAAFAPAADGAVTQIVVQQDGKILVAGDFAHIAGATAQFVRLNPDGSLDHGLVAPADLNDPPDALALDPAGKIYISSSFGNPGQFRIKRLNGAGDSEVAFAQGAASECFAVRTDGMVVCADSEMVKRYRANGSLDGTYNSNRAGRDPQQYIKTLLVGADGALYVGGDFPAWMANTSASSLVRLKDLAAPPFAAPSLASKDQLHWTQASGSGPAAERVLFQWSGDAGATWQDLGYARCVNGDWVSPRFPGLPTAGQVRALACVRSGAANMSQGLMVSPVAVLARRASTITVEDSEGSAIVTAHSPRDFGAVGVKAEARLDLVIRNAGDATLSLAPPTITGPDAKLFSILVAPEAQVRDSTTLTLRFSPASVGAKAAALHLASNDPLTPVFDLPLTGLGVVAGAPVVKTLPAQVAGPTSAAVKASVDPKGTAREVIFEYGLTKSYGSKFGSAPGVPLMVAGVGEVQAPLSGLKPHTLYHCRVVASSALGMAVGQDVSFITANRSPVAAADAFTLFTGGTTAVVDLLANDTDPDADTLHLVSIKAPAAATGVRVAKSGNMAIITAANGAASGTTFTYTVADSFGGKATGSVEVNFQHGFGISPTSLTFPEGGGQLPAQVTLSALGKWSARPSAAWIKCNPPASNQSGPLSVIVPANTSQNPRSGTITFQDGTQIAVSQEGIHAPLLTAPAMVPAGMVSSPYDLDVASSHPATFTAAGLPPGLKIDAVGHISGRPSKAGKFTVNVKAHNAAGSSPVSPRFDIVIAPLPDGLPGAYQGTVGAVLPGESARPMLSRFDMTVTAAGSISGKIFTGATSHALTGYLIGSMGANAGNPVARLQVSYVRNEITVVDLTLDAATGLATGAWQAAGLSAWRRVWDKTSNPATTYGGDYAFQIRPPNDFPGLPQGTGFATFTVNAGTGDYKLTGRLADGSVVLTSGFVGPSGQFLIYQSLLKDVGTFAGSLLLRPTVNISGSVVWFKPPALATDKSGVYRVGFPPAAYAIVGAQLPVVAKGGVLLGLTGDGENARLSFSMGGLELEGREFSTAFHLGNPSASGLTNIATFGTPNPNSVRMTSASIATGAFAGEFTLPTAPGDTPRKATFVGQVLKTTAASPARAVGYFLLPQPSPSGSKAPPSILSGLLTLQGN